MVLDPLRGTAWTYNQTWHSKGKQNFCHGECDRYNAGLGNPNSMLWHHCVEAEVVPGTRGFCPACVLAGLSQKL